MKLHIYEHCPFCVRARMIFGIKKIPFELRAMPEAEAETPTSMVGKKIAPILEKDDGTFMAESMDIVHYVDGQYGGRFLKGTGNARLGELETLLEYREEINESDFRLYPLLRSLTIVNDIRFGAKTRIYLDFMSALSGVNTLFDQAQ